MSPVWSIVLLLFLLGTGIPVAWSFAGTLAFLVVLYDVNLNTLLLQGFRSLNSVVLLALPLFIMVGYLTQSGGIARRILHFIEIFIHGRRGGLGATLVTTCGVFGAISGTASAAVASIGSIMVEPMEKRGYPRGYTSALLGISSLLGILIPPSITMILFAVVTQSSVAACFAATIIPGFMLAGGFMVFNYFMSGRWFKEETKADFHDEMDAYTGNKLKITWLAIPALCIPVVILGGIYGGVFTPTEAAAVCAFLAMFIGVVIYRNLSFKKIATAFVDAGRMTGVIAIILLFSFLIGRILVSNGLPQDLAQAVTGVVSDPLWILITLNVFLILVGMVLDDVTVTAVIAPLLIPLAMSADVSVVQFAAIVACSVVVGSNSPPMAPILFMSSQVCKVDVHKSFKPVLMLIICVAIPVQLIVTFVPQVSLFLPQLFGLM